MARHVKKAESPARAVKRVCRARIARARGWLSRGHQPKAVHATRKEIKRLRAAIRLVRQDVRRKDYQRVNRDLRATAKSLAASRDARVMVKAFESLTGKRANRFARVGDKLRENNRSESSVVGQSDLMETADKTLRRVKRRIKELKLKIDGWSAVDPGLRRTYQRGRDAWNTVGHSPSPEHFHEWRKRVKNLGYQLELLCPDWPGRTRSRRERLEALGELLGEDHDLAMLREFVSRLGHSAEDETASLERLIVARERKLRRGSMKLGNQIFTPSPAEFCHQVAADWNTWRSQH